MSSDFWPDEDRTRLSQFTFFNGLGRSIVRRRSALLLFASSGSCHDRVAVDAGAETQPYEKRAAIADGHCINSQQKRPHQQAESTELQRRTRCSTPVSLRTSKTVLSAVEQASDATWGFSGARRSQSARASGHHAESSKRGDVPKCKVNCPQRLGCSAQCGRCAHSIKRIMDERPTCASGCAHAHASMH